MQGDAVAGGSVVADVAARDVHLDPGLERRYAARENFQFAVAVMWGYALF